MTDQPTNDNPPELSFGFAVHLPTAMLLLRRIEAKIEDLAKSESEINLRLAEHRNKHTEEELAADRNLFAERFELTFEWGMACAALQVLESVSHTIVTLMNSLETGAWSNRLPSGEIQDEFYNGFSGTKSLIVKPS